MEAHFGGSQRRPSQPRQPVSPIHGNVTPTVCQHVVSVHAAAQGEDRRLDSTDHLQDQCSATALQVRRRSPHGTERSQLPQLRDERRTHVRLPAYPRGPRCLRRCLHGQPVHPCYVRRALCSTSQHNQGNRAWRTSRVPACRREDRCRKGVRSSWRDPRHIHVNRERWSASERATAGSGLS